jgi:LAGLIDADG DNA endonuclease family
MTRQTRNPNQVLEPLQKEVLVGSLLGDCWIELGTGAKNARVGLQLTKNSLEYFNEWVDLFKDWIDQKTYNTVKAFGTGPAFPQVSIRTFRHPEFTKYYYVFRPPGSAKKLVPAVSWLMANFTDNSLAALHTQDGSRHGIKAASGFDLHSQGFDFESNARLALMLYEKFGLYAYPTRDIHKKLNKVYWNIYISSDSYEDYVALIQHKMVPAMAKVKFPVSGRPKPSQPNPKNNQPMFYAMFKDNQDLRENLQYSLPASVIEDYAKNLKP